MPEYKKIVYCTDFSDNADQAFKEACYIASLTDSRMYVVHVVPEAFNYQSMAAETALPPQPPSEDQVIQRLQDRYVSACPAGEAVLRYGNEATSILEYAKEVEADLIVMGARGLGFLANILGGGSITDKVVKNAQLPVLVVPHK